MKFLCKIIVGLIRIYIYRVNAGSRLILTTDGTTKKYLFPKPSDIVNAVNDRIPRQNATPIYLESLSKLVEKCTDKGNDDATVVVADLS